MGKKESRTFIAKIQNRGKDRCGIEIPKSIRDYFSKGCILKITVRELE